MNGLDIEGVLAGHQLIGKSVPAESEHECRYITKPHDGCGCKRLVIGCSGCEWQIEVSGDRIDQHRAHVAAVLREQIADWLLGDEAYREVAFRSILNEGAAWTALRTLAALVAPGLVSRAACGTCGGATAVTDGETVCVSGSRLPHPPTTRTSSPSRVPGEET